MTVADSGGNVRKLAPFACDPARSRGRLHLQELSRSRDAFQRDRDRIVHSTAFRRLKYKTQVFVYHEGDHFRTRLTHSLEVSQIARAMARMLDLNEDLVEALALAHDLGHPPFGHAGENALNEVMRPFGGFDHNAQSLRVVTALERRYALFDGLNLSWETLEGLVKHNGPLSGAIADGIVEYNQQHDLDLTRFSSLEAQLAAISDDIAYDAHDIDDGLRAGLLDLDVLHDAPLVGEALGAVDTLYPGLERQRRIYETSRRLITRMVDSVVGETRRRIADGNISSVEDVRNATGQLVAFDEPTAVQEKQLKAFLFTRVYRHDRVMRVMKDAAELVRELFAKYMSAPETLPHEWPEPAENMSEALRARIICDFVAGMTDRFAMQEHARLFDATADLR